jgi:chitobiase/beta-hexosaminidase-like protein
MRKFLLLCFLGFAPLSMAHTVTDSCTGTTSCSLAGTHAATDIVIIWAYRAASTTAPTLATSHTNITNGSSSTGASRSWRAGCSIAGSTGSVSTGTWTNATNIVAFTISGTGATSTGDCVTNGIGTVGTANNVSSATATYSALTMSASPTDSSNALLVMGSSTSGQTCTPTGATVINNTGDVRASLANAAGNWSTTTCAITSSVTTEIVIELKAALVANPTFSPNGGTFGTSASTALSDSTPSSTICYTTDGSTPAASTAGTCSAGSTYSSALAITTSGTAVKALGTESGFANSAVATSSAFTLNPFLPNLGLLGVSGPGVRGLGVDSVACPTGPSSCPFGSATTSGTTATTNSFSTGTNVALMAFVTGNVAGNAGDVSGIVTTGLTWVKVVSATGVGISNGFTSIWRAQSTSALAGVTAQATMTSSTDRMIYVVPFTGADLTGTDGSNAVGANNKFGGSSGAPSGSVTTTRDGSWIWGILEDWSTDVTPVLGSNQTQQKIFHGGAADSSWVQSQTATTTTSGTSVTINDTSPTADNWDLAVVEVMPAP